MATRVDFRHEKARRDDTVIEPSAISLQPNQHWGDFMALRM